MLGGPSAGAQLTGYSTDSSGLVTTGVWKLVSPTLASARRMTLQLPADFVAVGGGAEGVEAPLGAMVVESYQSDTLGGQGTGDWRRWTVRTSDLQWPQAHRTIAYAIGMRITGMKARDLIPYMRQQPQDLFPAIASVAANQSTVPPLKKVAPIFVALSGGVQALADAGNSANLLGQFVTVTAPVVAACPPLVVCKGAPVTGWRVESKDHLVSHPGTVGTVTLGIAPTIVVAGVRYNVVSMVRGAVSEQAAHPWVDVSGLRGNYALTGIGATVDWRDPTLPPKAQLPGNLLWKLEPRADLGGATVASKDHGLSSLATITGYAIGIRLVPAP